MTGGESERCYQAAICSDEVRASRRTAALLRTMFRERGVALRVDSYMEPAALTAACRGCPARYDLLLMADSIGGEDGIAAAKTLRAEGCRACIAFVSGSTDRAFASFDAEPTDYLLRPVTRESLGRLLDRAFAANSRPAVPVETEHGILRVYAGDISYVEVSDRALSIHLRSGIVNASGSLTALAELLPPELFFRCHKSYLVNLDFIERVYRYRAVLADGVRVPVGKARYLALRDAFISRMAETAYKN